MTVTTCAPTSPEEYVPTPIDDYLGRQQQLTAVERFAGRVAEADEPAGARWWNDRLPATGPGPGQQYGFRVDLDACTGCKACVAACHNLNGLEPDEGWRRVGTLYGTDGGAPRLQTITTACHHCVEPACLLGCPANAYEKDPITGIVRHLDDACIGCSYCTLTCPYEVPVFDRGMGIVRKCDMCADRLSEGEAPACVQGCPTSAITIDIVDVVAITEASGGDTTLVPGAPRSSLTVPTTTYVSAAPLPADLVASDRSAVHPSHGHTPLAVMLVLTQVSVGAFILQEWRRLADGAGGTASTATALVALGTGLVALGASIFHLGRPLLAWRAVLGFGHSWLSREIVAFSVFAAAATLSACAVVTGTAAGLQGAAAAGVVAAGLAGVACSAQLYAATGRSWWGWRVTGPRFLATMGAGGGLLVGTVMALSARDDDATAAASAIGPIVALAAVAMLVGILVPLVALTPHRSEDDVRRDTRQLLAGPLRPLLMGRVVLGLLGAVVLPLIALAMLRSTDPSPAGAGGLLLFALVATVASELLERRLFFLASVAPRMPGMLR